MLVYSEGEVLRDAHVTNSRLLSAIKTESRYLYCIPKIAFKVQVFFLKFIANSSQNTCFINSNRFSACSKLCNGKKFIFIIERI